MTDTLRQALRSATRALHVSVDEGFSRFDLADRRGYAQFLTIHAQAAPAIEAGLNEAGAGGLLTDWAERRRTAALVADLADLELATTLQHPEPLRFQDRAELIGGLYVLEGSRLGGAMLARRVAVSSDPVVQAATRYLSHGRGRRFWSSFLDVLKAQPETVCTGAIRGAELAFSRFQSALAAAT